MAARALKALLMTAVLTCTTAAASPGVDSPGVQANEVSFSSVLPVPVSSSPTLGAFHQITGATTIFADQAAAGIAHYLAGKLRASTGFLMPVQPAPGSGGIQLLLTGAPPTVGDQGYQLDVSYRAIVLRANKPAGLFHGVQTLRQLLPEAAEAATVQPGPWPVPGGTIVDHPRFPHRSAMLDVARHFFAVAQVKRYIDQLVLYKVNHLHLHLSDDQGWRIAIDGWPKLTTVGGRSGVGGGPGGYYTKSDYAEIVKYAAERYVTIVPEIDMPGHTNAALVAYPQLNCDGTTPRPYTGMKVGFSSLCVSSPLTYTFVEDVIRQLAALTPGPYFHIGGDEAHSTTDAEYATFINRVHKIVTAHGKTVMGWQDIVWTDYPPGTVFQFWYKTPTPGALTTAASKGNRIIMSPANRAYLDMKYNASTRLGLNWAGTTDLRTAYEWDPGTYLPGIGEASVLGVEAPLWSETIRTNADIEFLAFPRLPALMELAWSPRNTHDWNAFQKRLGAQGPRWRVMGMNFYHSPQVAWQVGSRG